VGARDERCSKVDGGGITRSEDLHIRQPFLLKLVQSRASWQWIVVGALLISLLYLPSLTTPFDFIDDGNLVYPAPAMPLDQRLHLVWQKIVANYQDLGPFRPTLWLHWETAAELFVGNSILWRSARLVWCGIACSAFLWFMLELGIHPVASLLAVSAAMWNPFRNEIWTSLTLSEGVAMPYALLSLVCAIRAARSKKSGLWDLAGVICMIVALGCKNTFMAAIPAQVFLRIAANDNDWRQAWRKHGGRACVLALTLLLPLAHLAWFKLNWHPGQYQPGVPTLGQLARIISGLKGAISLDFFGIGLFLTIITLALSQRSNAQGFAPKSSNSVYGSLPWRSYALALTAAGLLLVAGVGVYLPMDAFCGRYTIPAVWGLDIVIGVLLSQLFSCPRSAWRRVAIVALVCGLVAVGVANIGKQQKFAARARLLWQALEWIEREAPTGARIDWVGRHDMPGAHDKTARLGGRDQVLDPEEGIHFAWHLGARGRSDLKLGLLDEDGHPLQRAELDRTSGPPDLVVSSRPVLPPLLTRLDPAWRRYPFSVQYWFGQRSFQCFVWTRTPTAGGSP